MTAALLCHASGAGAAPASAACDAATGPADDSFGLYCGDALQQCRSDQDLQVRRIPAGRPIKSAQLCLQPSLPGAQGAPTPASPATLQLPVPETAAAGGTLTLALGPALVDRLQQADEAQGGGIVPTLRTAERGRLRAMLSLGLADGTVLARPLAIDLSPLWRDGSLRLHIDAASCEPTPCRLGSMLGLDIPGLAAWTAATGSSVDKLTLMIDSVRVPELAHVQLGAGRSGIAFALARDTSRAQSATAWSFVYAELDRSSNATATVAVGDDKGAESDAATVPFEHRLPPWSKLAMVGTVLAALVALWVNKCVWLRDSAPLPELATTMTFSLARCQMFFWMIVLLLAWIAIFGASGELLCVNASALALLGLTLYTGAGGIAVDRWPASVSKAVDLCNRCDDLSGSLASLPAGTAPTVLPAEVAAVIGKTPTGTPAQWMQDIAAFKAAQVQWLGTRLQASSWVLPDLWEDNDNKLGLHRMQNLVFSLFFGALFIRAAIQAHAMMDVGENQLALMGISGTCYIGFKRWSNRL